MKRNIYDLSCYQAINGVIGRLQTVFNMPVLANSTVSINLLGNFKLSQLRRWLALDAHIHLAFYFVKHRWCYDGSGATTTWDTFIKNSLTSEHSSASTLETIQLNVPSTVNHHADWLGLPVTVKSSGADTVPAHYVKGYNKIWNRWYRVPNNTDERDEDYLPTLSDSPEVLYGAKVARLPNFWNTGVNTTRLNADPTITESGGAGTMTLLDIANIQAEYQDDLDRDWFSHRYKDLMASKWGSNGITNEVDDNQAELLMDSSQWASGIDIHGTDSASLGNYVGKTQQLVSIQMPPRYFNEHGMIWCVMAVRFPSICSTEAHYTALNTLTADNFLGYPEIARSKPPIEITEGDCFADGDTDSFGKVPYMNWFRYNNNRITEGMDAEGFPFLRSDDINASTSFDQVTYEAASSTGVPFTQDRFFAATSELKHWNMVSKAEIEVRSPLPTASESIFAGARHIN